MNLVDKDRLDIIESLRAEVSIEKEALAAEVERLTRALGKSEDSVQMQLSQVRPLLHCLTTRS